MIEITEIREKMILCQKCNGTGEQIDHSFGICTFGIGYLTGAEETCSACDGKGHIKLIDKIRKTYD